MKQIYYFIRKTILVFLFIAVMVPSAFSANGGTKTPLEIGIAQFGNGDYKKALLSFREVVVDSSLAEQHGSAYFWIARSYMALEDYAKAEQNIEFFLSRFSSNPRYPDALYQKGRLLYLQEEYEKSIRQLYRYIEEYPSHPYKANAYYWLAESLYGLGHYDKAETIFSMVVRDYPTGYKVEAARYRLSLIELKRKEEELLKLLKLSHEEYLKTIEDFDRKEKSYEQAIAEYQRKLAAATADNDNELIDALNDEIAAKNKRLSALQSENQRLREQNAAINRRSEDDTGTVVVSAASNSAAMKLLELKSRALSLKEQYIKQLAAQEGLGK
jgi:TolA-binding protein